MSAEISNSFCVTGARESLASVKEKRPLVHCITNYVTVNDCANALLAIGASPVMADDIREVEDIVSISSALVINIGTLNERTIASMLAAGKKANSLGIPVVLDPVGAGASRLRTETALSLVDEISFAVIRGNLSEITTLAGGEGKTRGVDSAETADARGFSENTSGLAGRAALAASFSRATGAVIAITGAVDIVSDGRNRIAIRNGHPMMAGITGSGCMLSAVLGAFCGAVNSADAAASGDFMHSSFQSPFFVPTVAAVCSMGIAGEIAVRAVQNSAGGSAGFAGPSGSAVSSGTGSFRVALVDALSFIDSASLTEKMKIENRAI